MNTSVLQRAPTRVRSISTPLLLRVLLIAGCACAVALVLGRGSPSALLRDDPELAQLLRGMAVIKSLIVVAALAVVTWRFGLPIDRRFVVGYLIGTILIVAATAMIWQLAYIVPAAIAFHVGGLLLLVVAWRDDGAPLRHRLRSAR